MFTIDLLKGKGLPAKSRPIVVAIAAVPLVIPLMATAVMAVCCFQNHTMIQTRQHIIEDSQRKAAIFIDDLKHLKTANKHIAVAEQRLNDINKVLGHRIQTTPFLVQLITILPDNLTITKIDLARTEQRKKEFNKKTGTDEYVLCIQRKLKLVVGGIANLDTDQSAEQYVQSLRNAQSLSGWFNDIQIVSRSNGSLDEQNCAFYEIECNLKEQK
jgi:hypothetical protein